MYKTIIYNPLSCDLLGQCIQLPRSCLEGRISLLTKAMHIIAGGG